MFSKCLTSNLHKTISMIPEASWNTPGKSQTTSGANEPLLLRSTKLLRLIQGSNYPLCGADNVFKSFYHCGPRHHKYFIVFNAINRFNIGENGQTENAPEWNQPHNTVIVHRYAIEPWLVYPFSKTFLNRPIIKEAAEGWEKGQRRSERESAESGLRVTVALPLHLRSIGDSSVWRAVFVLYCYWWHFGVTVSRWNGSPPTSQPAAAQPVEQWGPDESGLEPRRPQLGATP